MQWRPVALDWYFLQLCTEDGNASRQAIFDNNDLPIGMVTG